MKQITPINTIGEVSRTIYAHYAQAGWHDFDSTSPVPHTAILEIEMEEPKPIQVAQIYDRELNPMNGRVYSEDGIAPTLRTPTDGLPEPKIMQIGSYSPSSSCNAKALDPDGICPTLLDHKGAEPAILTPIRTEKAKELRRQGIETFANRELVPRTDGCSGTITTVQKDNLLREPYQVIGSMQANAMRGSIDGVSPCLTEAMGMGGGQIPMIVQNAHGYNKGGVFEDVAPTVTSSAYQNNNHLVEPSILGYTRDEKGRVESYHEKDVAGTIHTSSGSGGNTDQFVKTRYHIRKLTPTECLRLMDCEDEDIQKMLNAQVPQVLKSGKVKYKPLPKTAAYKLAGNSICVAPLYYIFKAMFVDEPPKPRPIQKSLFDI